MKKIFLLLYICVFFLSSLGAETINQKPSKTELDIETYNLNFFITNFYHQLKNDASTGSGDWLNSLYHELNFEGKDFNKNELIKIFNNTQNPIQVLSYFEEEKQNTSKKIEDFLKCDEIRICFATPFLENPMSYFGHVFIEFYQKDNPFFSYVLSYLGDTENISKFEIYTKAIKGNLNGKYTIQPFFTFYNKYIINENRNIISYKLSLTKNQKIQLTNIITNEYEKNTNYSFIFNNCMDGLLKIINQIDGISIVESYINSPADLINRLLKDDLLSDKVIYASYIENQNNIYYSLTKNEKIEFNQAMIAENKIDFLNNLETESRQKIGSLLSSYYYYDFHHNNSYNDDYTQVINYKVKNIPITTNMINSIIPKTSSFFQFDKLFDFNNSNKLQFTFRPLFSELGEQCYGNYNQGAIEILKTQATFNFNSFNLNEITWIKLLSINKISRFQKKLSWKFEAKNKLIDNHFPFIINYDLGYSLGNNNMYLFGYIGNNFQTNTLNYKLSIGASLYYIIHRKIMINLNFKESLFSNFKLQLNYNGTANINYFLTDSLALNSSLIIPVNEITIGFKYYINLI